MDKKIYNDWEVEVKPEDTAKNKNYNLDMLYKQAHEELSLQQSKRDQIMTIYLALCSFLLPFALGEIILSMKIKGMIFLLLGVVGMMFSFIAVRYREYKEVYWLCCQTITILKNYSPEEIHKNVIQSTFYHCLRKKGKGYLIENGENLRLNRAKIVRKNIFSSETLHYVIIVLMASFISGLGVALLCFDLSWIGIILGVLVGLLVFFWLCSVYFRIYIKIYIILEKTDKTDPKARNAAFNRVFSKAWFLHFYYDD